MVFTTDFSCLGVTTPNRFLDVLTFGDDMANGKKRTYGTLCATSYIITSFFLYTKKIR